MREHFKFARSQSMLKQWKFLMVRLKKKLGFKLASLKAWMIICNVIKFFRIF